MTSMLLTLRYARDRSSGLRMADIAGARGSRQRAKGCAPPHPSRSASDQPAALQSRKGMFFSFAYFAADSSIIGRTIDWSEVIQSVIAFHLLPSHCRNF